jgi:[ribosomal protein S5]-alanine N-acetyltransferase
MLSFAMPSDLETERLALRAPDPADADRLFAHYTGDPEIVRYLPWQRHRAVEETRTLIEQCGEASAARIGHLLVMAQREQPDRAIGLLHFSGADHSVSLGFGLLRQHWGQGYGREVASAAVTWLLRQPGVWRAWAYCDIANSASARVLEQAGLSYEGTLRRYAIHPNYSPDPRDCRLYARVRA